VETEVVELSGTSSTRSCSQGARHDRRRRSGLPDHRHRRRAHKMSTRQCPLEISAPDAKTLNRLLENLNVYASTGP